MSIFTDPIIISCCIAFIAVIGFFIWTEIFHD